MANLHRLVGFLLLMCLSLSAGADTKKSDFEIYLFRHGKTLFNTTDQVQGWSDSPLTKEGIKGAEQAGEAFRDIPFNYAWSSDLGRARATARIILKKNRHKVPEIIEMEGLREVFYGSYEGKTNFEIMKPLFDQKGITVSENNWNDHYEELLQVASEEWMINQYHLNDPTKQAETYQQVLRRTKTSIDDISQYMLSHDGGRALVVTHGEQIAMVIHYLFPEYKNTRAIKNCSLTIIKYHNGKYYLEKTGDDSFLH